MPTLLSETDQFLFDNKIYSVYRRLNNSGISYHLDFADYDLIKSKYNKQNIVVSGWMSPHDDQEFGHQDCWVFQVLAKNNDNEHVFVHTLLDGRIVGNTISVGSIYSFLYKKTHALLPKKLAIRVINAQNFYTASVVKWIEERKEVGYSEKAQLAWYFLDNKAADLESDF